MVSAYVYEVRAPFFDPLTGIDAWENDVIVWRAGGIVRLHLFGGQLHKWVYPPNATITLFRFADHLVCDDPDPPALPDLVLLAVGAGLRPQPPLEVSSPPALRLL